MQFQKGQSGNPQGGKRERIITQRLVAELKNADGQKLHLLANKLLDRALDGDVTAIREVIDRVEGKAAQPMEHSGQVDVIHSGARERLVSGIAGITARIGTREPSQLTH